LILFPALLAGSNSNSIDKAPIILNLSQAKGMEKMSFQYEILKVLIMGR